MCETWPLFYIIVSLLPFYIIAIVFNFLSIFRMPYQREEYKDFKESLEKPPIISISFDQNYFNNLKGKINKDNVKDLHKALIVKRLNKKYNYKYLLNKGINKPGFHQCGIDNEKNCLFLPINIECPINDLRISNSSDPNSIIDNYNYYNYNTKKLYDGIYLHYTNENIHSTILTDIDFKILDYFDFPIYLYKKINITSPRISEENSTLYLIMKNYIGINEDLNSFLSYNNKLYLNIASLILLFQSLVTLFIDNIKFGEPAIFHIITTISLYIQLVIQIIIYIYYGDLLYLDVVIKEYYDIKELNSEYFKYNTVLLSFIVIITGLYISLTTIRDNDKNYYYYLVYCIRYIFFNKCCYCCKERVERNKDRNRRIILELDNDIQNLDNKISECDEEERDLIDKNENLLFEIKDKSNILTSMKDEENSFWNMNEEEEIKFEKKFKELKNDNELNIRKFKNLKNQIKRIEKEINYYKMIEFKQELNNK